MLLQFILTGNYKLYQLVSTEMKGAGQNFVEQDVKNKNFSNLRRSNFNVEISRETETAGGHQSSRPGI